ncbi:hypothetical protein SASPL_121981 [Salvia splendens]|uniref:Uncharacterized protein n=1 Tax=Salvia splendens TaxID=180675 RepID=A0A8X8XJ82_SALSN|nr:hypothetical protein SASPL_121981 [Salvia splendens]
MSNKHTIILMQTSQHRATRTFMDYESITQAMDVDLYWHLPASSLDLAVFSVVCKAN